MRGPLAVLLAYFTIAATAAAEPAFPYNAYITGDDVYVRSGPGENYYPTDKLKAGTEIEVYRHDPGGGSPSVRPRAASPGSPATICNPTATTWRQ